MSGGSSRRGCHRLWASSYYCPALEIAPLLRLQAYFRLQQSSVSLPQQSAVCVRVRDCRVHQKNNEAVFVSLSNPKVHWWSKMKRWTTGDTVTLKHVKEFRICQRAWCPTWTLQTLPLCWPHCVCGPDLLSPAFFSSVILQDPSQRGARWVPWQAFNWL